MYARILVNKILISSRQTSWKMRRFFKNSEWVVWCAEDGGIVSVTYELWNINFIRGLLSRCRKFTMANCHCRVCYNVVSVVSFITSYLGSYEWYLVIARFGWLINRISLIYLNVRLSCLGLFGFIAHKDFTLFDFPVFWLWTYPMNGYSTNVSCALN